MNINLFEMRAAGLEYFDVREPNGNVVRERDPKLAKTLSSFQPLLTGHFGEDALRRMTHEHPGGSKLDGGKKRKICRSRSSDSVHAAVIG
jgi:hypothetical protein